MLIFYGGMVTGFFVCPSSAYPLPFIESPACPFIGSRGGRDAEGALGVKFVDRCRGCCSDVPREWPAIPGYHDDVKEETVKRLRILWHASLVFMFDRRLIEAGSRWVDDEWIRSSPRNCGVRYSLYSPSRVISGGIVPDMARTVTSFHRPSWDGQ
jgi:hypothetical protein